MGARDSSYKQHAHRAALGRECALSCVLAESAACGEPTSGQEDAAGAVVKLLPPCWMRRLRRAAPTVPPDVPGSSATSCWPGQADSSGCSQTSGAWQGDASHASQTFGAVQPIQPGLTPHFAHIACEQNAPEP